MSAITDPISDMLTRIRNANLIYKEYVDIPMSNLKFKLAEILKREGFIKDFDILEDGPQKALRLHLKYIKNGKNRERVIIGLKRVSKPGLRVYVSKNQIPKVLGGLGVAILTTSKGVLTGKEAKEKGVGGELLCYIW